jgi:hypothetical protein
VRRLVWVGVGAVVTVVVIRQGRKALRRYGPAAAVDDVTARANDLGGRITNLVRDFGGEFRAARDAREAELGASLLAEGQPDPDVVRAERKAERERGGARGRHERDAPAERDASADKGPLPQDPEDPEAGYAFF